MTNAFILCDLYEKFRKIMKQTDKVALIVEVQYQPAF